MNTSKLLITSLLAAAASLSVPAYAETYTISGNNDTHLTSATADDTIIFNLASGHLNGDRDATRTVVAAVRIDQLNITDGYTGCTYVFNNTVTGSGDFTCGITTSANNQKYTFNGDVSGYSGNIEIISGKYGTLTFTNKTGTKTITATNASSVLNLTGATVNNSAISVSTVNIGGATSFVKTTDLNSGNIVLASGAAMNIASTGALDLSSSTLNASNGTVSIATDGSLNLSGATVSLANAIQNSGTVTISESTVFNLTKTGATTLIDGGTIAGVEWNTLTSSNFTYNGAALTARSSVAVSNAGAVTLTYVIADLTWTGTSSTTWDVGASQNWTNASTSAADVFYNYDNVTFDASTTGTTNIAAGVTVTDLTISGGTHTFTVSSDSYVKITGTASVENGATLVLDTKTEGTGLLRGAITVKSGGELQFTKGDLTGYNGGENSLSSITIDAGGTLYLNHSTNETFAGTLTLNGTLSGKDANTRWDMFKGNSEIVVAAGANALIDENVKLVIRRDNAPITVGADATLTITGQVLKASLVGQESSWNGVLVKNGAGTLTLNGTVDVTGVTQNAGKLTIGGAATITTLTVSGGTTTFASSSSVSIGSLSMQTGASATQTSGIVTISGDVRLHTSNATTTETYTLSGGVLNITKTASSSIAADTTADDNYNASAISLGVWKNGEVQLAVQGGTLNVLNSQVLVGFDSSAEVAMSSGEMNVKGVVLYGKNSGKTSKLTVTGGRLNVGSEGLITSTASSSNATKTISISDATVGSLDSWSANGSITLGGTVTFDTTKMVALTTGQSSADATDTAGTTITLNGVLSGDGALKKTGAGTLTLSGNNTFTGGVTLSAGTLELGHNNALGNGTYSALTVTGDSELKLGGGLNVANNVVFDNSAGTVSALTINVAADTELSGGLLSFDQNEIRKVGAGTLTLSGDNQWFSHGTISIEEGTILAKSANALGAVAEASDNKVRLSGGQLEVGSGVTLAQTNIEIVLSDAYSSTAAITGTGALAAGARITIADIQAAAIAAESALGNDSLTFQIATAYSTIATSLAKENFVLAEALQGTWQISDYTDGVLTISAIPEPSVFGLLAGLGALALAGTRRRRKKA